jgi:hypothetical protein
MCLFSTPPLQGNRSQYELDAARRCPFYIAARIVKDKKIGFSCTVRTYKLLFCFFHVLLTRCHMRIVHTPLQLCSNFYQCVLT